MIIYQINVNGIWPWGVIVDHPNERGIGVSCKLVSNVGRKYGFDHEGQGIKWLGRVSRVTPGG